MTVDSDPQLQLARRLVTALAEDLGLEKDLLRRALGRDPTRAEMAGHIQQRFRADSAFRRTVTAIVRDLERGEAEDLK
jgi:hypothetical protein